MSTYPKFLKIKPKTLGLGPIDFIIIIFSLAVGLFLSFSNMATIGLCGFMILLFRVLTTYFDFQVLLLKNSKTSILSDLAKKDINERSF